MADKPDASKKKHSPDWFMQGALTRLGDSLDQLTGRRWTPASNLATSGLIQRLKMLLDSEAKPVPGKGTVVPHNIKLKMQWDKFSADEGEGLEKLRQELLTAAADHVNDSLYYTYAPLNVEVKADYFVEGVKLFVGFEKFVDDENSEAEVSLTNPSINAEPDGSASSLPPSTPVSFTAAFETAGKKRELLLNFADRTRLTVGRSANNDLLLDDVSVSKIHASLALSPDGVLDLADTGSTNGTFVNGERISYGQTTRLRDEDEIRFGTVDVAIKRVVPAPESNETAGQGIPVPETAEPGPEVVPPETGDPPETDNNE